jgi:pimeloyl-ACP methyl ester carboxylesterase
VGLTSHVAPDPWLAATTYRAGVPLHTERRGRGRPLVLLPSFSLDHVAMAAAFEPVLRDATGWCRIYLDLPGTGRSPAGLPSSDAVLDDVVSTIQHLVGDEPVVLLGWSYGGYLAAGCARRLAGQVAGLMLVCSGLRIREEDRDLAGVLDSASEPGWLEDVPPHLHEHLTRAVGRQRSDVARRVASVLSSNGPTDEPYLARLRTEGFALVDEDEPTASAAPVSLVGGRSDRVAGFVGLLRASGSFERASIATLADAGHYLPVEEPAATAALVGTWLGRCSDELGDERPQRVPAGRSSLTR